MLYSDELPGYTWVNKGFWQNLEWHDEINGFKRLQQISLEPRPDYCDRGRFISKYDTVTYLTKIDGGLHNYYFNELVAKVECQNWANLISKTIRDELIEIKEVGSEIVHEEKYYQTKLSSVLFVFKSGLKENVTKFDAFSKDEDLCVIDFADFFPRYYLIAVNAITEEQAWNNVWRAKNTDY